MEFWKTMLELRIEELVPTEILELITGEELLELCAAELTELLAT